MFSDILDFFHEVAIVGSEGYSFSFDYDSDTVIATHVDDIESAGHLTTRDGVAVFNRRFELEYELLYELIELFELARLDEVANWIYILSDGFIPEAAMAEDVFEEAMPDRSELMRAYALLKAVSELGGLNG